MDSDVSTLEHELDTDPAYTGPFLNRKKSPEKVNKKKLQLRRANKLSLPPYAQRYAPQLPDGGPHPSRPQKTT